MKTAIIYYSKHHQNTKKLLDAICEKHNEVQLFNVTDNATVDLTEYDRIGFASGIYYSKFQKQLFQFAKDYLPDNKQVFFVYTYGAKKQGYTKAITQAVQSHNPTILGEYGCFGFNTFGPFKLIGGIAKGHPDADDLSNVVKFYEEL